MSRRPDPARTAAAAERLLGPVLAAMQQQGHWFDYGQVAAGATLQTLNLPGGGTRKHTSMTLNGGSVQYRVILPRATASITAGEAWLVLQVNGNPDDLVAVVAL